MISRTTLEEQIKLFGISNQLLEHDLDRVERELGIDLGRSHEKTLEKDQDYYPQLDRAVRQEAARMSKHYEIFYSLERSIRTLIADTLEAAEPSNDWWESGRIPQQIKSNAEAQMKREVDTGVTPRSPEPIDFTNF